MIPIPILRVTFPDVNRGWQIDPRPANDRADPFTALRAGYCLRQVRSLRHRGGMPTAYGRIAPFDWPGRGSVAAEEQSEPLVPVPAGSASEKRQRALLPC